MKYLLALLFVCTNCFANDVIKLIVPFSPGGTTDVAARLIQDELSHELKKTVVVEYKLGAGGEIGHSIVANTKNETVLCMTTSSLVFNAVLGQSDLTQFEPLIFMRVPFVLVTTPSTKITNLNKVNSDTLLRYGTFGVGSATHLLGEKLRVNTGKNLIHVPYKGAPQIIQDLLANNIELGFLFYPQAKQHLQSGTLVALAIDLPTSKTVPTFNKVGLKELENTSYVMLVANITNKKENEAIRSAMLRIMSTDAVKQRFSDAGFVLNENELPLHSEFLMLEKQRIQRSAKNIDITK